MTIVSRIRVIVISQCLQSLKRTKEKGGIKEKGGTKGGTKEKAENRKEWRIWKPRSCLTVEH